MKRKNKLPAPIIALVLATGPLTGVAALPTTAQAATPIATAPAEGVVRQRSDYGFELFRRAICMGDQSAWEAIFSQYRGMLLARVRQHRARTSEDDEALVNLAIERFWMAVGPEEFVRFPSLAALLRYEPGGNRCTR